MSGVRAGRCWDGGEDGEDGRWRGGGQKKRQREGQGKLEKERGREWWTLEREEESRVGHFREPWDLAVV